MNLLIYTHILLWYLDNNSKLPEVWKYLIEDSSNLVAVSSVNLCGITIKISLGKLELKDDISSIKNILNKQCIELLPIQSTHLLSLLNLPFHHSDPFDRLIIAQAQAEQFTLVIVDNMFAVYSVSLLD